MVENMAANVEGVAYGVVIATDSKWFPRRISRIKAAVYPECGEVSLYINPEDLKK